VVSFVLYCTLSVWYVMLPLTRILPCIEDCPCVANWRRCHIADINLIIFIEFVLGDEFPAESRKVVFGSKERFLNRICEMCAKVLKSRPIHRGRPSMTDVRECAIGSKLFYAEARTCVHSKFVI
jgi:hypothetical protein